MSSNNQPRDQIYSDDPGLFFIMPMPSRVHDCMSLPSVANLNPPLQRGTKNKIP